MAEETTENVRQDDWQSMYATLLRIKAGERGCDIGMDAMMPVVIAGFVESVEQTKPCRTCGTPQFDFRYERITGAGRVFMEAAAAAVGAQQVQP